MESNIILYTSNNGEVSIQVQYEDGTFWLTQKRMAELFGVNTNTINYHLKDIYHTGELKENRTIRKIRIVQTEGKRKIKRAVTYEKELQRSVVTCRKFRQVRQEERRQG